MGQYGVHGYFRKLYTRGSISYGVQTISATGAGSTVSAYEGVTLVGITGATADKTLNLARPVIAGFQKQIICTSTGVQKLSLTINGSTLTSFLLNTKPNASGGSTFRTIVFSSKSTQQRSVILVAKDSTTWAVLFSSTAVTFAG